MVNKKKNGKPKFNEDDASEILHIVLSAFSFMPCDPEEILGERKIREIEEEILDYVNT